MADPAAVTYSFNPGDVIASAKFDQNFQDLVDYLTTRFGTATSAQVAVANSSGSFRPVTTSGDLTNTAAGTWTIGASKVTTGKINDSAVTTAKINDSAVTGAKIAASAVDSSEIADGAVGTSELAAASVTAGKMNLPPGSLLDSYSPGGPAVPLSGSWTTYLSVTPVANATYLVMGNLGLTGGGSSDCVFDFRFNHSGSTLYTVSATDLLGNAVVSVPFNRVITVTTTDPIAIQAQKTSGHDPAILLDGGFSRLQAWRVG